jgi:prepilin-type N-terminal cleavage/methylation domain-containing protein
MLTDDPKRSFNHSRRSRHLGQRGFTLIELVMVLVVVGALAVFAVPRMLDLNAWRLRAFADEMQSTTAAMLRLALAQRKPIMATFSTAGVTYAYVAGGALGAVNCPAAVPACLTGASVGSATFNASNGGTTVTAPTPLTLSVTDGTTTQYSFRLENDTGLMRRLP